jgi:hypothetical protein
MALHTIPVGKSSPGKRFRATFARQVIPALTLVGFTCPSVPLATEGGTTHHLPGGTATLIDLAPTKPGWVAEAIYLHYAGEAAANLPVAGIIGVGLDATSDALLFGGFYTFKQRVAGARYTLGVFLPYVWISAEAEVDTPLGTVRRRDDTSGLGDMTLLPAMLAWKLGYFNRRPFKFNGNIEKIKVKLK